MDEKTFPSSRGCLCDIYTGALWVVFKHVHNTTNSKLCTRIKEVRMRNDQTTWYKAPFFLSEILVHDMIQILILVPMFPDKGLHLISVGDNFW